jgi:hypothetical protein
MHCVNNRSIWRCRVESNEICEILLSPLLYFHIFLVAARALLLVVPSPSIANLLIMVGFVISGNSDLPVDHV